jgi:hypothetical protein
MRREQNGPVALRKRWCQRWEWEGSNYSKNGEDRGLEEKGWWEREDEV